ALASLSTVLVRRGQPGDLEEAERLLRRSLAAHPNEATSHYKLAQIYRRTGRAAEAEKESARFQSLSQTQDQADRRSQVAASFEDSAAEHLKRGNAALAQGDADEAAAEFRLA